MTLGSAIQCGLTTNTLPAGTSDYNGSGIRLVSKRSPLHYARMVTPAAERSAGMRCKGKGSGDSQLHRGKQGLGSFPG